MTFSLNNGSVVKFRSAGRTDEDIVSVVSAYVCVAVSTLDESARSSFTVEVSSCFSVIVVLTVVNIDVLLSCVVCSVVEYSIELIGVLLLLLLSVSVVTVGSVCVVIVLVVVMIGVVDETMEVDVFSIIVVVVVVSLLSRDVSNRSGLGGTVVV